MFLDILLWTMHLMPLTVDLFYILSLSLTHTICFFPLILGREGVVRLLTQHRAEHGGRRKIQFFTFNFCFYFSLISYMYFSGILLYRSAAQRGKTHKTCDIFPLGMKWRGLKWGNVSKERKKELVAPRSLFNWLPLISFLHYLHHSWTISFLFPFK